MRRSLLATTLLAGIILLFTGCNPEASKADLVAARGNQLQHLHGTRIVPLHDQFVQATAALDRSAETFVEAPSQEHLEQLRAAWEKALLSYKRCETYNLGDVASSFIRYDLHRWPIDTAAVEKAIRKADQIDRAYVDNLGTSATGLAAVEYLIFGVELAALAEQPARLAYLHALCARVADLAEKLWENWQTYATSFQENTQLSILGGQNQLVNALVSQLEETTRFRLGNPLGEESGGTPRPTTAEAPYAEKSLVTLRASLDEWGLAFFGGSPGDSGYGFDDYLSDLGDDNALSDRIASAFTTTSDRLDGLLEQTADGSLRTGLMDHPEQVLALQNDVRALKTLVRVDLASLIGATVTINDTDGD
ncbi:MAG: imelysin family protein [Bacteroidota bacterium]